MLRVLVLLALVGCPGPQRPAAPAPGSPLALIEASPDLDGTVVGPTTARATIVVLMASWCGHCRAQLDLLAEIHAADPNTRILGVNYKGHEEYDNRGNPERLRAYVAEQVPWLRVVPADVPLFRALGRPPFVPAVWVFSPSGALVASYDRRERAPPTRAELDAVLAKLPSE
jgi:thiol-disulfide isomerase/thioredoxin